MDNAQQIKDATPICRSHPAAIKNYTFSDINRYLKDNNFEQYSKFKMPFRKSFEYIYKNKNYL